MKFRYLICIFFPLSALPLLSQDQNPAATAPSAPLKIQENPVTPQPTPTSSASPSAAPVADTTSSNVPPPTSAATPNPFVPGPAPTNVEPAAPSPDAGLGSPGQNPPPSDPNSLIPPPLEPLPPSPINTAGNDETQRQQQKVRYYTVKVKADKDEDLSSLLNQADKAKSDEAKRQALREYYDLLAKRMKKLDSSIADWIDTMHAAYLRRLDQVRVEPTIPINLPPTPVTASGAEAMPTSSPTPKKKKQVAEALPGASQAKAKPVVKATPTPTPVQKTAEKKHWFFFRDHPKPTPSPSPTATPASKKKAVTNAD
jgi:hypothetical protein